MARPVRFVKQHNNLRETSQAKQHPQKTGFGRSGLRNVTIEKLQGLEDNVSLCIVAPGFCNVSSVPWEKLNDHSICWVHLAGVGDA